MLNSTLLLIILPHPLQPQANFSFQCFGNIKRNAQLCSYDFGLSQVHTHFYLNAPVSGAKVLFYQIHMVPFSEVFAIKN